MQVSIAEVPEQLDELLRRVEAGEAITIVRDGHPVAVLRRPDETLPSRAAWREKQEAPTKSVLDDLIAMRDEYRY